MNANRDLINHTHRLPIGSNLGHMVIGRSIRKLLHRMKYAFTFYVVQIAENTFSVPGHDISSAVQQMKIIDPINYKDTCIFKLRKITVSPKHRYKHIVM